MNIFKRLFCSHDYDILTEHTMKSQFEIVQEYGKIPNSWTTPERRYIATYKCSKCGKVKIKSYKN